MLESVVGFAMLIAVVGIGTYVHGRGGIDPLDQRTSRWLGWHGNSHLLTLMAGLGTPLFVGIIAAAAAVACRRDPPRALACLFGPLLAGALTEFVFKPAFDTRSSRLSFPSGHTTGTAALTLLVVLAAPRWRKVLVPLGVLAELGSAFVVVAVGWHTLSEALAGLLVGTGALLFVDGGFGLIRQKQISMRRGRGRFEPSDTSMAARQIKADTSAQESTLPSARQELQSRVVRIERSPVSVAPRPAASG